MREKRLCGFCGEPIKQIGTRKRDDTQFHDDNCRQAYHVEKKRLNRAANRAVKAIEELSAIRNGTALNNRVLASKHLADMQESISWRFGSKWKCGNCGDEITREEQPTNACKKCSRKAGFINVQPQIS